MLARSIFRKKSHSNRIRNGDKENMFRFFSFSFSFVSFLVAFFLFRFFLAPLATRFPILLPILNLINGGEKIFSKTSFRLIRLTVKNAFSKFQMVIRTRNKFKINCNNEQITVIGMCVRGTTKSC